MDRIYISQRAFTAFLLWVGEILQDFVTPKQALINAFYLCLQTFLGFATAKLLYFFELSKKRATFFAISSLGNAALIFEVKRRGHEYNTRLLVGSLVIG